MAAFAIPETGLARESSAIRKLRLEIIEGYIEEAAASERLEPALLRALIKVESNFNHQAVSPVGARGLMQIMPDTAEELGDRRALRPNNPRANIRAGAKYLRSLINQFAGDLRLALAAYNAGPAAVLKHHGVPPFAETRAYVVKVMGLVQEERERLAETLAARGDR